VLEPKEIAVRQREVVDARDPHRARLCVQPWREVANRADAPADAMLRLEHQRLVALAAQLERGHETGDAATDDDHALGCLGARIQPLLRRLQGLARNRRLRLRRRRPGHVRFVARGQFFFVHGGSLARCPEQLATRQAGSLRDLARRGRATQARLNQPVNVSTAVVDRG
jgi:hypothetical protein